MCESTYLVNGRTPEGNLENLCPVENICNHPIKSDISCSEMFKDCKGYTYYQETGKLPEDYLTGKIDIAIINLK